MARALLSIGDFARLSRLSPRALRLYDELGLLAPARVDPDTGYRWYAPGQLDRARMVASLRGLGVPLARIERILGSQAAAAADEVAAYWLRAEAEHAARRELAGYLVDRLNGERSLMYEVAVRDMPARSLLSLQRHVRPEELLAVGKEFVGRLRHGSVPRPEGIVGAPFVIYYGEVSGDSDGPIEWCWPVLDDRADEIAARFPDLVLRVEAAHQEAFVHLPQDQVEEAQTMVVLETLFTWTAERKRQPSGGVRQIYLRNPAAGSKRPDCDFAVPLR